MNTSNVVLKAAVKPEWRKLLEVEDSDFGGGAWVPWKWVLPLRLMPQVPRIWERLRTRPKRLFRRTRWRTVAPRQVEMHDTEVEGAAEHCADVLELIDASEVVP